MADGLLVSHNYVLPQKFLGLNQWIDEDAQKAGPETSEIWRDYILLGVLNTGREDTTVTGLGAEYVYGSVQEWADKIVEWYGEYGQDTFNFWPVAGNQAVQIEAFAQEVIPAVRETI